MSEKNKLVYSKYTFTGSAVKEGGLCRAASLLSSQLEADILSATVECSDPALIHYTAGAKLTYFHREQQKGTFYLQSIQRVGPSQYALSALSAVGRLSSMGHTGGIYTGQTAESVIKSICGSVPVTVKSSITGTKLYGWLPYASPPDRSARDNLSQVLFALGAAMRTDLDGVLHIIPLWDGVSVFVGRERMYQGGSVEYDHAPVSAVSVTEHQYAQGGEEVKLFEGETHAGDIIVFQEPAYGLSATGFTIQASNANYAKVSAGSGILKGRKYLHSTREITESVHKAAATNVKSVTDATLVSLVNSRSVAQRLAAYYQCTERIKTPVADGGETPGDVVSIYHPYDKTLVTACVERVDSTMSAVLKSELTALAGFRPKQIEKTVTYDQHQLVTASGTVTLPEGVTSLRAVLIGGGSGGNGGRKGSDGTAGSGCSASGGSKPDRGQGAVGAAGKGGAGGGGGTGGSGGKIASFEIPGPIQSLTISIGGGGSGGGTNQGSGSAGSATTLTVNGKTYSSASGAANSAGYQDLVTGTIYARPGGSGSAGAAGGDGGEDPDGNFSDNYYKGNPGKSAGSNPGGAGGNSVRSSSYNNWIRYTRGGGGGGAAYSAAGGVGTTAGGTGATGTRPAAATHYGNGGTGGNGGGGGGGGGGSMAFAMYGYTTSASGGAAGTGGSGGPGGTGAPGCVILYYSIEEPVLGGALRTKNNRLVLDRLGRIIVV